MFWYDNILSWARLFSIDFYFHHHCLGNNGFQYKSFFLKQLTLTYTFNIKWQNGKLTSYVLNMLKREINYAEKSLQYTSTSLKPRKPRPFYGKIHTVTNIQRAKFFLYLSGMIFSCGKEFNIHLFHYGSDYMASQDKQYTSYNASTGKVTVYQQIFVSCA